MGVVKVKDDFIKELRAICDEEKIVLIFDEVMTGFRVAAGGAQEVLGIKPDLSTFGKIIGGGLPVGAFGGKREIMEKIAPSGPVYQAGTIKWKSSCNGCRLCCIETHQRKSGHLQTA